MQRLYILRLYEEMANMNLRFPSEMCSKSLLNIRMLSEFPQATEPEKETFESELGQYRPFVEPD